MLSNNNIVGTSCNHHNHHHHHHHHPLSDFSVSNTSMHGDNNISILPLSTTPPVMRRTTTKGVGRQRGGGKAGGRGRGR